MAKKLKIGLSVVIGFTMLFSLAVGVEVLRNVWEPEEVQAATETQNSTISVVGNGKIMVEPDVAYISLGIETKADSANESQTNNATIFAQLEKVLYDTYKVDQKDVQTTEFRVNPQYHYANNEEPKITGYTTTHMIQITYRKLDQIGQLLDAASNAGANRMENIRFDTEKKEDYEVQALEKAMANAKLKAQAIAKTENRSVGRVVNVIENGSTAAPQPLYRTMNKVMMDSAESASTSISGGQVAVTAQVSVQYEF